MVRENNPELKASLNRFLKSHRKGTLMGNIHFNRYYKSTQWLGDPLGPGGGKKFKKYAPLFKKYSSRYGFDWVLILAMAYQESKLDQNKKSHVGAVGVMQVMPRTARDKNVGINNIRAIEGNVHAGVKYLDFLRDRYFSSKKIKPRDRVRFAMASYNAGPGNITRAQALAEKMGLNPNRWFRNVELATLRIVGREPVRYVSNINKYYLMYKLGMKNEDIRRKKIKSIKD
jgi:membrane-bound lytic murein transglycosylase MltF